MRVKTVAYLVKIRFDGLALGTDLIGALEMITFSSACMFYKKELSALRVLIGINIHQGKRRQPCKP